MDVWLAAPMSFSFVLSWRKPWGVYTGREGERMRGRKAESDRGNTTTKEQWRKKRCWGRERKRAQKSQAWINQIFVYCLFCLWIWTFNILCVSVKWHVHLTKFASGTHLYIHLTPLSHLLSHLHPILPATHFPSESLHCIIERTIFFFFSRAPFRYSIQQYNGVFVCVHFFRQFPHLLCSFCQKMFHNA